ncbi:MAG: XrtA system polysaccharide deacetylase [Gammaproteobacteria bacterium]
MAVSNSASGGARADRAPLNALSIDVEEYFQVSAFESVIDKGDWSRWPSRVEVSTQRLLDLFAAQGVHATFFTLGWVAERFPALVRRIVDEGHELACHGYDHVRLTNHTPESLGEELRRSKALLEDASGVAMRGFRAASFSIDTSNLWAFGVIEAAGFDYSSSVYPVHHDLYGIPDAERVPFRAPGAGRLVEIPVATARYCGRNLPAGGGGYFRLFPYWLSAHLLRTVHRQEVARANMYFHPWEFDPEQPRPAGISPRTRFRHYLNQNRALSRLERLLGDFRWAPFADVYADCIP